MNIARTFRDGYHQSLKKGWNYFLAVQASPASRGPWQDSEHSDSGESFEKSHGSEDSNASVNPGPMDRSAVKQDMFLITG